MSPAKLFIRSVKIPIMTMEVHDVPGHYCQNGYRTASTMMRLSSEETQARDILTRAGVKFEVVDLSEGRGGKKFKAWLQGIKTTPTLLEGSGHHRRFEGLKAISEYAINRKVVA